jgi:hypothetical protein
MLMRQRHGADQREVLSMVAARACLRVEKRKLARIGIRHEERLQQALCVAVHLQDLVTLTACQQPFDGLAFSLLTVDSLRLCAVFIHGEHQAAVQ